MPDFKNRCENAQGSLSPPAVKKDTPRLQIPSYLPARIIFAVILNAQSRHTPHDQKMPEDLTYRYVGLRQKRSGSPRFRSMPTNNFSMNIGPVFYAWIN